jgi:hypothetical protein
VSPSFLLNEQWASSDGIPFRLWAICHPTRHLLHTLLHTWVFFRVLSALPAETVVVHQRLVTLAPEVGLGSIITQMFEFTSNNYNDFRHLSSSFCHVSNGVLHYNFLTVLLTVLAVPKKQISSDTDITHSVKMEKLPQHSICNLRRGSESNRSGEIFKILLLRNYRPTTRGVQPHN